MKIWRALCFHLSLNFRRIKAKAEGRKIDYSWLLSAELEGTSRSYDSKQTERKEGSVIVCENNKLAVRQSAR